MSKQIFRSGKSIGANIREADHAQSKADFIHKLSISLKEANETEYWLDLLFETKYLSETEFQNIKNKNVENTNKYSKNYICTVFSPLSTPFSHRIRPRM